MAKTTKRKVTAFARPPRAHPSLDHWVGWMSKTREPGESQSPAMLPRAERQGRAEGHGKKVGDGRSD